MELLAPAGNLEKLKAAILYGADAVYCGGGSFSLRAANTSFSLEDLAEGMAIAHHHQRRLYLALNIFPFDQDLPAMKGYLKEAIDMGIDGVILSDPGVLTMARELDSKLKIHLSTQANITNSASVRFWREQGVDRIVLARELSLEQIKGIREKVPEVELEVFAHGAMCVAFSGRCLLSQLLTDRSANRGQCSQPCRWEYEIREVGRDEWLGMEEDERGTYLLNSRDLCMIEHLPALAEAGVSSLKIEGRMKTAYYVAAVTRVYRAALDLLKREPLSFRVDPEWLKELEKVSHRPYTSGFYIPGNVESTEYPEDASYIRDYDFVGVVDNTDAGGGMLVVSARNYFARGDQLEIIVPGYSTSMSFRVEKIINCLDEQELEAAHNSYQVKVLAEGNFPVTIREGSIIRRKI